MSQFVNLIQTKEQNMELTFSLSGQDYVIYQDNFQEVYVNGCLSREWILRRQTASGREFAGTWHIPAWKDGKHVTDHLKEILTENLGPRNY